MPRRPEDTKNHKETPAKPPRSLFSAFNCILKIFATKTRRHEESQRNPCENSAFFLLCVGSERNCLPLRPEDTKNHKENPANLRVLPSLRWKRKEFSATKTRRREESQRNPCETVAFFLLCVGSERDCLPLRPEDTKIHKETPARPSRSSFSALEAKGIVCHEDPKTRKITMKNPAKPPRSLFSAFLPHRRDQMKFCLQILNSTFVQNRKKHVRSGAIFRTC